MSLSPCRAAPSPFRPSSGLHDWRRVPGAYTTSQHRDLAPPPDGGVRAFTLGLRGRCDRERESLVFIYFCLPVLRRRRLAISLCNVEDERRSLKNQTSPAARACERQCPRAKLATTAFDGGVCSSAFGRAGNASAIKRSRSQTWGQTYSVFFCCFFLFGARREPERQHQLVRPTHTHTHSFFSELSLSGTSS